MPGSQIAANFEEGSAGAAIVTGAPDRLGLDEDAGGADVIQTPDATYSADAHSGSLAALSTSAITLATVEDQSPAVIGGGGWFKRLGPVSDAFGGTVFADVRLIDNPSDTNWGVAINSVGDGATYQILELPTQDVLVTLDGALNEWQYLSLNPTGAWVYGNDGGVLASGTVSVPEEDRRYLWQATGLSGPGILVDDLWVIRRSAPAVRLYPRDDGLGMSSAPRIHPAPKSGRIIGGHQ